MDVEKTNATWDTGQGVLLLGLKQRRFGAFFPNLTSGVYITADEDYTSAVALGDVDGDLDLVTGNGDLVTDGGVPNRLYLNNGTNVLFGPAGQHRSSTPLETIRFPHRLFFQTVSSDISPVLSAKFSTGTSSRSSTVTNMFDIGISSPNFMYRPCFNPRLFPPASRSG